VILRPGDPLRAQREVACVDDGDRLGKRHNVADDIRIGSLGIRLVMLTVSAGRSKDGYFAC
jgi:hypothetical protein